MASIPALGALASALRKLLGLSLRDEVKSLQSEVASLREFQERILVELGEQRQALSKAVQDLAGAGAHMRVELGEQRQALSKAVQDLDGAGAHMSGIEADYILADRRLATDLSVIEERLDRLEHNVTQDLANPIPAVPVVIQAPPPMSTQAQEYLEAGWNLYRHRQNKAELFAIRQEGSGYVQRAGEERENFRPGDYIVQTSSGYKAVYPKAAFEAEWVEVK